MRQTLSSDMETTTLCAWLKTIKFLLLKKGYFEMFGGEAQQSFTRSCCSAQNRSLKPLQLLCLNLLQPDR